MPVSRKTVDRESAYEKLMGRAAASTSAATAPNAPSAEAGATADGGGLMGGLKDILFGSTGPRGGRREGVAEAMAKSAGRAMASTAGRELIRGVLGSLLGGGKRR